ncbi:Uncharacterized protein M6B38_236300 [Iris pallida]|uniref:Uncharacterized protein n=1 Tax=Iris pallida TaxID=29817 RepID=A0AAX6DNX5_IRIPA|nr:Uncharacterized protein M6B38_236300 [Iris pallida]
MVGSLEEGDEHVAHVVEEVAGVARDREHDCGDAVVDGAARRSVAARRPHRQLPDAGHRGGVRLASVRLDPPRFVGRRAHEYYRAGLPVDSDVSLHFTPVGSPVPTGVARNFRVLRLHIVDVDTCT